MRARRLIKSWGCTPWEGTKVEGMSDDIYDAWEAHTKSCASCRIIRKRLRDKQNVLVSIGMTNLVLSPILQNTRGEEAALAALVVCVVSWGLVAPLQQVIDQTESLHYLDRDDVSRQW